MRGYFLTTHKADRKPGSRIRKLTAPVTFYSAILKKRITAPKGFEHNGPSFPLIWGGDGEAAAAIHDFMYANPKLYTRAQADDVLREALDAEGMNWLRRNGWWLMVRAGGWKHYGRKKAPPAVQLDEERQLDHSPGA